MQTTEQVKLDRFKLQEEYLGTNKAVNNIEPLISVVVITYQQKSFIKDCLDGVLMQQTTYPFEIIIGEDGSTDGTGEICKEYAEKYPDKIRLFIRDRKLSQYIDDDGNTVRFNVRWSKMSARGKYIAFCEGDDYWTDPYKLQKQVAFLEENEDYGLVYTNVDFYFYDDDRIDKNYITSGKLKRSTSFEEHLCNAGYIAPCTWVYRNKYELTYDKLYVDGTFVLALNIWADSKIHFIEDSTATYRVLTESASHSKFLSKIYRFSKGLFDIQKEYIEKYNLSDEIRQLVYRKSYSKLFPAAILLNDSDLLNEAEEYWENNKFNNISIKEFLIMRLRKLPRLSKILLKLACKYKGIVY